MLKTLPYLLILSLLGNLVGLFALYKAYDYRKKMILAWAQSHEWTSEFHARPQSADQPAGGVDVVLLGASITAHWDPARHLPGFRIINKGIDGQFASQLLLRFQHDVIDLHPKMVVIKLCEMNFAHQVPFSISRDNVKMMTALARANGIQTVVATVIPVTERYDAQKKINQTIHAFNRWLGEYAAENQLILLDLAGPLSDAKGFLQPAYTDDGVHPNLAGYERMTHSLHQLLAAENL
ncbi:hypothetical protein GX408_05700 [bacterium]|nr:hypothetical protein [bacterium]